MPFQPKISPAQHICGKNSQANVCASSSMDKPRPRARQSARLQLIWAPISHAQPQQPEAPSLQPSKVTIGSRNRSFQQRHVATLAALLITVWPDGLRAAPADAQPQPQLPPIEISSSSSLQGASTLAAPSPGTLVGTEPSSIVPVPAGKYVPSPVQPGWEVYVGFLAGVIPFTIGSWEFGKRIIIQRRCALCAGRGLVPSAREGSNNLRKCPECGGFFPWISWKMFLTSTTAPGNGGPLQQPKGQTSVLYSVPDKPSAEDIAEAQSRYAGAEVKQEHDKNRHL